MLIKKLILGLLLFMSSHVNYYSVDYINGKTVSCENGAYVFQLDQITCENRQADYLVEVDGQINLVKCPDLMKCAETHYKELVK